MATLFPFRGITYNIRKIKDPSLVLTQPYDKIIPELQERYYRRHKYNLVRITKGKDLPGDNERVNQYHRARVFLDKWLKEKILVQDQKPCLYAYYQEYKVDHELKIRKGFIALARLEDFGKGGVHAHEQTLLKPKQDRLNMMRTVGGSTGQIFMLYSDPKCLINKLLDQAVKGKQPDLQALDDYGEMHKLWKIKSPEVIKKITDLLDRQDIFIADGHHRYETALNYRNEMRAQGLRCQGNESYENRMMTFINMDDEGLTVLPTHRLIYGLPHFSLHTFVRRLRLYFHVIEYPFTQAKDAGQKRIQAMLLKDLRTSGAKYHCFGLVARPAKYFLFTLKDAKIMDRVIKESHSPIWKRLDVTILHSLVLERLLGVSKDQLAREEKVEYRRHAHEVFQAVKSGKYQIGFLLNSTKINELKKVAQRGERMPQKSTDFYPKLLSGIVISKIAYL